MSGNSFPEMPFFSFDKLVHTIEFGLFGIVLFRAFITFPKLHRPFTMTVIASAVYAASDELHQYFVPGRDASVADFVFDVVGIAVFTALYMRICRNWERTHN